MIRLALVAEIRDGCFSQQAAGSQQNTTVLH